MSNKKEKQATLAKKPVAGTIEAGNTIYRVFVEDIQGSGVGLYTATTGPNHPAGDGLSVLFGNGSPGTSFNTFRSFTTNTDYTVVNTFTTPPFTLFNIEPYAITEPIGTTGVRTTYILPGPPISPDELIIVQDVNIIGDTFNDSYIEVRVGITNIGNVPAQIGIRYLWDFIILSDDGPTFQALLPNGPVLTNEAQFTPPTFEAYQMVDNDTNPSPPTFIVYGTALGTSQLPLSIAPSKIQYASWSDSVVTAFDYTTDSNKDIADEPINDTAVLYYWGHNTNSAVILEAGGGSFTRIAALFATKPGIVPPFINNNICAEFIRIFGACRQEAERTMTFRIPELKLGTYLGCSIKSRRCFVLRTSEPNEGGIVEARILLSFVLDYQISISGPIRHIFRLLNLTTTTSILAPEGTCVSCEILESSCESTVPTNCLIQTSVQATVLVQSKGIETTILPFVAGCPTSLCNPEA